MIMSHDVSGAGLRRGSYPDTGKDVADPNPALDLGLVKLIVEVF